MGIYDLPVATILSKGWMRKQKLREVVTSVVTKVMQNWDLKPKMPDFNPTIFLLQNCEGVYEGWNPGTPWMLES